MRKVTIGVPVRVNHELPGIAEEEERTARQPEENDNQRHGEGCESPGGA